MVRLNSGIIENLGIEPKYRIVQLYTLKIKRLINTKMNEYFEFKVFNEI